MASSSLSERTQHMLQDRPRRLTYAKMAEDLNDVSAHWLWRFTCGKLADPNCDKVQQVYEYLSGKPLFSDGE